MSAARAFGALLIFTATALFAADAPRWWKGNLHTHTFWSDGDDYPDMVADWYKSRGYHFLAFSDHNTLQVSNKWTAVSTNRTSQEALRKYLARFGEKQVERRDDKGKMQVRLKRFDEMSKQFNEPNKFLLIQSQEITDRWKTAPIHINAHNLREAIKPRGGSNVVEVMQNNVNAVFEQRKKTGQPMIPHLNHPNFGWAVTAEELAQVRGERFFEVYNGHASVNNAGDTNRVGMERLWDIVLTKRLAELNHEVLYGLATDDGHNYHTNAFKSNNPGRGWVFVRTAKLDAASLVTALEAGEFYSSTGVTLLDVRQDKKRIEIEIEAEAGVEYTTQFIGTRAGYDPTSEPVRNSAGLALRTTRRYSETVGSVLAETKGATPRYELKGDEIYVRARITSTKLQENPYAKGELAKAWTQPVVNGVK